MTPDYSSPFQHPLFVSPDVSQCLPSTPNDSNSRSLLPNYTPNDSKRILAIGWQPDDHGGQIVAVGIKYVRRPPASDVTHHP